MSHTENAQLVVGDISFSIAVVAARTSTGSFPFIVHKDSNYRIYCDTSTSKLTFGIWDGASWQTVPHTADLPTDGTIHHIFAWRDK
ncbi:MAG: hypothetical protein V4555_13800, partial [Acidobacteriota bacterium]